MRSENRAFDALREMTFELDYLDYPAGSCLVTAGRTRVLCAVTVENRVPPFLVGSGTGWLTAEYSLLPCATHERTMREAHTGRLSGRTQEIRTYLTTWRNGLDGIVAHLLISFKGILYYCLKVRDSFLKQVTYPLPYNP